MRIRTMMALGVTSIALALLAPVAKAEPLTFFFEGHIDTLVDIGLDESVDIGTPFFGSYTFDPVDAADSSPGNPHFGFYGFLSPAHLSVTVGNYEFVTNDLLIVAVNDDLIGDFYAASNWSNFYSNGFEWYAMGIFLLDTTRTALDSDALPHTPPDLVAFPFYTVFSAGIPGHLGEVMGGPLTSLTPEPGSLALFAFGAILFCRRSTRWGRYECL